MARKIFKRRLAKISRRIVILPVLFLLTVSVFYFLFDSFIFEFLLLQGDKDQESAEFTSSWHNMPYTPSKQGESVGGSASYQLGLSGLQMMYLNQMSAGYNTEILQIIKDHITFESMRLDNSFYKLSKSGATGSSQPAPHFQVPVSMVLGSMIAETGLSKNGVTPKMILSPEDWQNGLRFSEVNSLWLQDNPDFQPYDFDRSLRQGSRYTQIQLELDDMDIYPDSNPNVSGFSTSKMFGYGTDSSRTDTDGAYLPDVISVLLQKTYGQIQTIAGTGYLKDPGFLSILYPVHNGGTGLALNSWAVGTAPGGETVFGNYNNDLFPRSTVEIHENNNVNRRHLAASGANFVGETALDLLFKVAADVDERLLSGDSAGIDSILYNFTNHPYINGVNVMSLLLKGCFFASESEKQEMLGYIGNGSTPFVEGALYVYRLYQDSSATQEDLLSYLHDAPVRTIDTDFYGPIYFGRTGNQSEIVLHRFDEEQYIYNAAGAGPYPVLQVFPNESNRGVYMSLISGSLCYWNMLLTAGVEVTFSDAVNDALGVSALVEAGPEGSYFWGTTPFGNVIEGMTLPVMTSALYDRSLGGLSSGPHNGEDYGLRNDTPLYAIADGTVLKVVTGKKNGGLPKSGNMASIGITDPTLPSGFNTFKYEYWHMEDVEVEVGDTVVRGQKIGTSGNTGNSSGPHLHLLLAIKQRADNTSNVSMILPFRAIYEDYAECYNAPRCGYSHSYIGTVFNGDGTILGKLSDHASEDRANRAQGYAAIYYKSFGLWRFGPESIATTALFPERG